MSFQQSGYENMCCSKADSFVALHTFYEMERRAVRDRLKHDYLASSSEYEGSTVPSIIYGSRDIRDYAGITCRSANMIVQQRCGHIGKIV